MKKTESFFESLMFKSRWLLAPFYLGLVTGILILLVKFLQEFIHLIPHTLAVTNLGDLRKRYAAEFGMLAHGVQHAGAFRIFPKMEKDHSVFPSDRFLRIIIRITFG